MNNVIACYGLVPEYKTERKRSHYYARLSFETEFINTQPCDTKVLFDNNIICWIDYKDIHSFEKSFVRLIKKYSI